MLAQAGQHAHFDLAPADLPPGLPALWPKRDHDAIGSQGQRQGRTFGRQWLWRRLVPLRHGDEVSLEVLQGLVAGRLHPPPHRPGADRAPAGPAQQPRRRRKRHKDRQGTAQRLQLPARPLIRLHPQGVIPGGHLHDGAALGAAPDPATPLDGATQAQHLPRGKALAAEGHATRRARRPSGGPPCPLGEHGFDEVDGKRTGHLPSRQHQRGECLCLLDRSQKTLHRRIIVTYAVVQA